MSKNMLGGAPVDFTGPLKDLLDKLSGPDKDVWLAGLKKFLRRENSWKTRQWEVWKSVVIGGTSKKELNIKLSQAGVQIGNGVAECLNPAVFPPKFNLLNLGFKEIKLVKISPFDLGIIKPVHWRQFFQTAFSQGLDLCPPDVGPFLRLKYFDQRPGERCNIAMEPYHSGTNLEVFHLSNIGDVGVWLHTYVFPEETAFGASCADPDWVFRLL